LAGFGPPPKQNARRPNRGLGAPLVALPSTGRGGKAPAWPLSAASKAERDVWTGLWRLPQAVEWERLSVARVVARYARLLVRVEDDDASTRLMNEVRQLEDRLGLNPVALVRLRWRIGDGEPTEQPGPTSNILSIRDRLRAVEGDSK
jgi:hypothetical protein